MRRQLRRAPAMSLVVALALFGLLTMAVGRGWTQVLDTSLVLALRVSHAPERLLGPAWLAEAIRDITALGSTALVTLVTLVVFGGFLMQRRAGAAVLLVGTVIGSSSSMFWLKAMIGRPRPQVVPHLMEVTSMSYPSGHATMGITLYLALALLGGWAIGAGRAVHGYALTVATVVGLLVGVSRVALGVHYPSDVLGGWLLGAIWISLLVWVRPLVLPGDGAAKLRIGSA